MPTPARVYCPDYTPPKPEALSASLSELSAMPGAWPIPSNGREVPELEVHRDLVQAWRRIGFRKAMAMARMADIEPL